MSHQQGDANEREVREDEATDAKGSATPREAESETSLQGEGNYDATQSYNAATREFVRAGRVEEAARRAAPADEGEAEELLLAEQAGKERLREEDPTVDRGRSRR